MSLIKTVGPAEAIENALEGKEVYVLVPIGDQTTLGELKGIKEYGVLKEEPVLTEYGSVDLEDPEDVPDLSEIQDTEDKTELEKKVSAKSEIDHGKIVALYTANPPRSVSWIADDIGCSTKTVINHLKREGIYKACKE